MTISPLVILAVGIALVLGLIILLRLNAFLALIISAVVVSLMACVNKPDDLPNSISRVAEAFGSTAGKIGIVIGLAAVIGQCMMESGAADRIVRAFLSMLGEKRAPWALMGSGYVLAVPVFFDTVFYLLVPLARSFYRRTGKNYLLCILAIGAGGAITHTLVPPTPGPLVMAAELGIDLGVMIGIGALVALPAAVVAIFFARFLDARMDIPVRAVAEESTAEPLADDKLPPLWLSLVPVLLPVLMIASHTVADTLQKQEAPELKKQVVIEQKKLDGLELEIAAAKELLSLQSGQTVKDIETPANLKAEEQQLSATIDGLKSQIKEESGFATTAVNYTVFLGDPNFALLLSTFVALLMYWKQRQPTSSEMSKQVELSLMSAGVIILITAAGSAFGAMLKVAEIGDAIEGLFGKGGAGMQLMFIAFLLAALLKVAQGSSTAAMIVGSSMMAGIIGDGSTLGYNAVYLATSIGAGSLVGSWMNDSGFWIFAKMGGLTEAEALKTWTPMLVILGIVSFAMSLLLANWLPLTSL